MSANGHDREIKIFLDRKAALAEQQRKQAAGERVGRTLTAAERKIMDLVESTIQGCAIAAVEVLKAQPVTGDMLQWAFDMHNAAKANKDPQEARFAAINTKFLSAVSVVQQQQEAADKARALSVPDEGV